MLRTDLGAPTAARRYPAGLVSSGAGARDDREPSAGEDPFADMVDRFAEVSDESTLVVDRSARMKRPQAGAARVAQGSQPLAEATRDTEPPVVRVYHPRPDADPRPLTPDRRPGSDDDAPAYVGVLDPQAPVSRRMVERHDQWTADDRVTGRLNSSDAPARPDDDHRVVDGERESDAPDAATSRLEGSTGHDDARETLAALKSAQPERNPDAPTAPDVASSRSPSTSGPDEARQAAISALRAALTTTVEPGRTPEADAQEVVAAGNAVASAPTPVPKPVATQKPAASEESGADVAAAEPLQAEIGQAALESGPPGGSDSSDDGAPPSQVPDAQEARRHRQASAADLKGPSVGPEVPAAEPAEEVKSRLVTTAARRTDPPSGQEGSAPRTTARAAQAIAAFHAASLANSTGTVTATQAASTAASVSAALLDTELPTQIIQAIHVQFDNGAGAATVRLNPGFLGGVTVGVQMNGASVVASLEASNATVREWMRMNEPMLRQTLAAQGLQLERLVIVDDDASAAGEDDDGARKREPQDQDAPRQPKRPSHKGTFELVL